MAPQPTAFAPGSMGTRGHVSLPMAGELLSGLAGWLGGAWERSAEACEESLLVLGTVCSVHTAV